MFGLGELRLSPRLRRSELAATPTDDERQAAWIVFSALGHPLIFPHDDTRLSRSDVIMLGRLSGLQPIPRALHPLARRDAVGWTHLPAVAVVRIARRAARRNRSDVINYLRILEARSLYRIRTGMLDREECESQMVAMALAREWATPPRRRKQLDHENVRLRSLVATAAEELEHLGRFRSADQLRAALD